MTLEHPDRLFALLALPLLYLLVHRRVPRREVATAHLAIWERAIRLRGQPPRPKLRFLFLALAFTCTVLAATGPTVGHSEGCTRLVVFVDVSASTGSLDSTGDSAWSIGRDALSRELGEWPTDTPLELVLCGATLEVLRTRVDQLASVWPDAPLTVSSSADPSEALDLSVRDPDAGVVVLADAGSPLLGLADRAGVAVIRTDVRSPTGGGIVATRVEDDWPLTGIRVELEIRGSEVRADRPVAMQVEGGVTQRALRVVAQTEDGGRIVEFDLERRAGGRVQIGFSEGDRFPTDDAVSIEVPKRPSTRVVGLGESSESQLVASFLNELLGGPSSATEPGGSPVGLVVSNGGRADSWPTRCLSFGTIVGPGEDRASAGSATLVDWNREHFLTRGLDLSELRVRRRLGPAFAASAGEFQVLLSDAEGPLMVCTETATERTVRAAFQLEDGNLTRLPAFPQLLRRCLRWSLVGRPEVLEPRAEGLLSASESAQVLGEPSERVQVRGLPIRQADPGLELASLGALLAILLLGVRAVLR